MSYKCRNDWHADGHQWVNGLEATNFQKPSRVGHEFHEKVTKGLIFRKMF